MAEKHTTLAQLRAAALRSKAETLSLLIAALEGVQVGMTITLPTANWSSGVQTIQNEFFLASNDYYYIISPDANSYIEGSRCGIRADNITTNGRITFRCETIPANDLTINIIRLEVET